MHTGLNSHADEAQCPLWVKSGRVRCQRRRPLRANGGLAIRLTLLRASDADDAFVISRHDLHETARRAGAARAHVSFVADDH